MHLLNNDFFGGCLGEETDINRWSKFTAFFNGLVHSVCFEVLDQVFIDGDTIIDSGVCKLVQNVVKSRCPFAGSGLRSEGAVVDHKGNAPVVHVWA